MERLEVLQGSGDQPKPIHTPQSQRIEARFQQMATEIHNQQYAKGIEKYDTPLETFNGRDTVRDMFEEWSDLGRYMTALWLQHDWYKNEYTWYREEYKKLVELYKELKQKYEPE